MIAAFIFAGISVFIFGLLSLCRAAGLADQQMERFAEEEAKLKGRNSVLVSIEHTRN
jgi:hypothetical protein